MKSTALFIIVCLGICAATQSSIEPLNSQEELPAFLEQLQKDDSTVGKMIMSMAQVHMEVGGPLKQLVRAINALVIDLKKKQRVEHNTYHAADNLHQGRLNEIVALLNAAESDVSSATMKLENILQPNKRSLISDIASLKQNIVSNKRTTIAESKQRADEIKIYKEKKGEHQDAIKAVTEAITLVQNLKNSKPSFVQIRSAKKSLMALGAALKGQSEMNPMIAALLSLAQNFASKGAIKQILSLLNQVRNNLVKSLHNYTSQENSAARAWVKRLKNLKKELSTFRKIKATKKNELVQTRTSIKKEIAFRKKRNADLKHFTKRRNQENAQWAPVQAVHEKVAAQFAKELQTVKRAISILSSVKVSATLMRRMNFRRND